MKIQPSNLAGADFLDFWHPSWSIFECFGLLSWGLFLNVVSALISESFCSNILSQKDSEINAETTFKKRPQLQSPKRAKMLQEGCQKSRRFAPAWFNGGIFTRTSNKSDCQCADGILPAPPPLRTLVYGPGGGGEGGEATTNTPHALQTPEGSADYSGPDTESGMNRSAPFCSKK